MVRIRRSKDRLCNSCKSNGGKFYDIGVGPLNDVKVILTLCGTCKDILLEKLILLESEKAEEK